jgi:septal ring factor EnvC (AmiA/AmiB activator)
MTTSEEVITKVKKGFGDYLTIKNVEVAGLIVLVLVISFLLYNSFKPNVDMTKMKELTTQNEQLKVDLAKNIKDSNDKIAALKGERIILNTNISNLKDQLKQKEKKYASIKEPKSKSETVTRLQHFGLSPK